MDIYPQDLGRVSYQVMLTIRAENRAEPEVTPSHLARLNARIALTYQQRGWVRGSGVPEETARHSPSVFHHCRRAIWLGTPGLISALCCSMAGLWGLIALISSALAVPELMFWLIPSSVVIGGVEIYYAAVVRPRRLFRQMHTPLTEYEMTLLKGQARDPLARDFLAVAELLLPLPAMTDAEGEKHLRRALSALGEAIEELPQQTPQAVSSDPGQMREQANRLRENALREGDPVVAASLERRAHSLTRRAQTVASIAVLLRRNQTLREEVSEQIEALRTGISALSVGSRQGAHELADLAASIQRVAEEAGAIAVAQTELETLETAVHAEATVGMGFENDPAQTLRRGEG